MPSTTTRLHDDISRALQSAINKDLESGNADEVQLYTFSSKYDEASKQKVERVLGKRFRCTSEPHSFAEGVIILKVRKI